MKKFKKLNEKQVERVKNEVKLMLAAHRDCLWNRFDNPSNNLDDPLKFSVVVYDGYYGEAFGIMRGLNLLGYGYFGSDNLDAVKEGRSKISMHNLKWWFNEILNEYLEEEGFKDKTCTKEKCYALLDKYRKKVRK